MATNTSADTSTDTSQDAALNGAVFVTGASGYLGALVVRQLAKATKRPIIAADVVEVPAAARLAGVQYCTLDVRDGAAVDRAIGAQPVHVVVHLAAIITPPRDGGRELAWDVDIRGTRHVLDSCVAHKVAKIIVTSSGAAYGYHADNAESLDEDAPLRGNEVFAYSHHKRLVEQMLATFRVEQPQLAQLVLRPGTILGASTKNTITALFERRLVMGLWHSRSPFVFVWDEDVARCIVAGVTQEAFAGVYNLAGEGTLSLREIAVLLGKPYVEVPAGLLRRGLSLWSRFGRAPYGPEQVLFLQHRPVLDSRRLREGAGFALKTSRQVFDIYQQGAASRA